MFYGNEIMVLPNIRYHFTHYIYILLLDSGVFNGYNVRPHSFKLVYTPQ